MNKLIVSKVYTIEIESEICCDQCHEIIHNQMVECPVCNVEFAYIDNNSNLNEKGYEVDIIQCEECETYFKKVDGNWYGDMTEEDLLTYEWGYDYMYPKVIQIDPPVVTSKPIANTKNTYTLDPKLIKAMKNFKLFEPLK